MYVYTVHQVFVSIVYGYRQNSVFQNRLLLSGTAVQFGTCPPLCTSSASPSRTLYHQVLTFGTMKFSSMSYPLHLLALFHMPTCCCGFHQVICVGLSALCLTVVHWGCYKIITIMFSASRSCLH